MKTMLTQKEKQGIEEILRMMPTDELVSLATTITTRYIKIETVSEAIKVVCMFASDPADVLRRKKMKKEYIFNYLYKKGEQVNPSGSKIEMLKSALKFWNSSPIEESMIEVEVEMEESPSVEQNSAICPPNSQFVTDMGKEFTRWFYRLLNSLNANFSERITDETFGEQHFCNDCKLHVVMSDQQGNSIEKFYMTNKDSAEFLSDLVLKYNILFNPNLNKDGVRAMYEHHGLVKIIVLGLLHQNGYMGVFEQDFGLIQDPTLNCNWKICFTNLKLRCSFHCLE